MSALDVASTLAAAELSVPTISESGTLTSKFVDDVVSAAAFVVEVNDVSSKDDGLNVVVSPIPISAPAVTVGDKVASTLADSGSEDKVLKPSDNDPVPTLIVLGVSEVFVVVTAAVAVEDSWGVCDCSSTDVVIEVVSVVGAIVTVVVGVMVVLSAVIVGVLSVNPALAKGRFLVSNRPKKIKVRINFMGF